MELPHVIGSSDGPTVENAGPNLLRALLAELDRRLANAGVPIDELLRPGLDPEVTRDALQEVGLVMPEELGILFAWHDGERDPYSLPIVVPTLAFSSLDSAVSQYVGRAESFEKYQEIIGFTDMARGWLPIDVEGRGLNIHCEQGDEPPLVRKFDPELFDVDEGGQVRSLCTVVTWWLECLDSGAWQWNGTGWINDFDKYPAAQKAALFY